MPSSFDSDDGAAARAIEGVRIRQAEQADLLAVFRLEKETFPQPWPFGAFDSFVGEEAFLVAVNPESQALFGYVVADTTPNHGRDIGHIKDLAVHPGARGRGLGRELLHRALSTLRAQGAAIVKLEVRTSNDPAVALYRSEGFEPIRRIPRYYENGEDASVMVLDLSTWGGPASTTDTDDDAPGDEE